MAKMLKRILSGTACITLLLTMLCLGGCGDYSDDSKQMIEKMNISAVLAPNGDMNVTETWKINLENRNKSYRNVYKTFPIDSSQFDDITDLSIYDEDYYKNYQFVENVNPNSPPSYLENACYKYNNGNSIEIGLFMPPIDEGVRTFTFHYTIKNCINRYQDVGILYYKFLSTDFTLPVTNFNVDIQLPDGALKSDIRAWLHCTQKSNLSIDSGSHISITAEQIPAHTQLETRICTPAAVFSNSKRTHENNIFPSILSEEQQWAKKWAEQQRWNYILAIIDAAGGIILFIVGIVLFLKGRKSNERYQVNTREYTHDIPEGNSPAGIAHLFYYYLGDITGRKGELFSSTLLELARKGYVKFEKAAQDDFIVSLTVKAKTENLTDLTEGEQVFLKLISAAANKYEGAFTMQQFEAFAKINYNFVDSIVNLFLIKSKGEIALRGYYESSSPFKSAIQMIGLVLSVLGIAVLFFTKLRLIYLPVGAIIAGALMIFGGIGKTRLSETGEYAYQVWHGLKKYMLEFSRMKEYGVPQLEVWEEYLVYATMMGISKQVCEQLKMVYPEINDSEYMGTYWGNSYLYFMLGNDYGWNGGMGSMDLGAMLSERMNTISSAATQLAHPPSSGGDFGDFGGGGFGGGGFSGGGGGFGGGGGVR